MLTLVTQSAGFGGARDLGAASRLVRGKRVLQKIGEAVPDSIPVGRLGAVLLRGDQQLSLLVDAVGEILLNQPLLLFAERGGFFHREAQGDFGIRLIGVLASGAAAACAGVLDLIFRDGKIPFDANVACQADLLFRGRQNAVLS